MAQSGQRLPRNSPLFLGAFPTGPGLPTLKDALLSWLARAGVDVKPSELLITQGSTEALSLALRAVVAMPNFQNPLGCTMPEKKTPPAASGGAARAHGVDQAELVSGDPALGAVGAGGLTGVWRLAGPLRKLRQRPSAQVPHAVQVVAPHFPSGTQRVSSAVGGCGWRCWAPWHGAQHQTKSRYYCYYLHSVIISLHKSILPN